MNQITITRGDYHNAFVTALRAELDKLHENGADGLLAMARCGNRGKRFAPDGGGALWQGGRQWQSV